MKDNLRVIFYDTKPGAGVTQWFLGFWWAVGAHLQKLFGIADEVKGFSSWVDAQFWLRTLETKRISSIQYWGHGSPAAVWMNEKLITKDFFVPIKEKLDINSLIWFRTCSTFSGVWGQTFAMNLVKTLGCTVAGHTRIIGLLQGGLHTLRPFSVPSWPSTEGEKPKSWFPSWLEWGNNTITCFQTKIPEGW